MSDLERARSFLADQDYEFVWESPDGREVVWRKGDIDVSLDENREWADITVPLSDLPSFLSGLSGLTLEDVEKAVEDTRQTINDKRNGWSASARAAGEQALEMFLRRLRQQVNGDTCTREEG